MNHLNFVIYKVSKELGFYVNIIAYVLFYTLGRVLLEFRKFEHACI